MQADLRGGERTGLMPNDLEKNLYLNDLKILSYSIALLEYLLFSVLGGGKPSVENQIWNFPIPLNEMKLSSKDHSMVCRKPSLQFCEAPHVLLRQK